MLTFALECILTMGKWTKESTCGISFCLEPFIQSEFDLQTGALKCVLNTNWKPGPWKPTNVPSDNLYPK